MTQIRLPISNRIKLLAPAVVAALALPFGAAEAQQPPPTLVEAGVWVNDTGDGAVEIYVCHDKASRLCGRIVWLKEPLNAQGQPKHDRYNPNESMRNRPICGLPVLGNLARDSEGGFDSGWIYDPKAGKSYSAAIRLAAQDRLVVTGYLGMKFMGKSFTWTRAPANLQRCEGAPGTQPISTGAKPAAKPVTTPGSASAAATPPKPKQQSGTSAASAGSAPATTKTTATAGSPAKATSATAAAPKPKPAQKPVKAVAGSGSDAPAPQPSAKPAPKPVQEADTATSWSGQ